MQSDWNSFCKDVVLENFNKKSLDKDSILDQICKSKYVCIIITIILILYNIIRKCILTQQYSTTTQSYEFLVNMCCISLNMHFLQSLLKFKNFIITISRY